ncbi:MAG: hypothetical protein Q8L55_13565 [Phycisphaerales bacterium]|nr:hypothetical protein [Phycisphaerales bacterium]
MNRSLFPAVAAVAVVAVMVVPGCEQKLTDEKFDQLKLGMTGQEVEAILRCGKGDDETPSGTSMSGSGLSGSRGADLVYVYKSGDHSVTVTYREGKAVQFNKRGF